MESELISIERIFKCVSDEEKFLNYITIFKFKYEEGSEHENMKKYEVLCGKYKYVYKFKKSSIPEYDGVFQKLTVIPLNQGD